MKNDTLSDRSVTTRSGRYYSNLSQRDMYSAALYLRVSVKKLVDWCSRGKVPHTVGNDGITLYVGDYTLWRVKRQLTLG